MELDRSALPLPHPERVLEASGTSPLYPVSSFVNALLWLYRVPQNSYVEV